MDREPIEQAIAANAAPQPGSVLTAWVLVGEWMDGDGGKHLTRLSSKPITTWQAAGMLHEALYGDDWNDTG